MNIFNKKGKVIVYSLIVLLLFFSMESNRVLFYPSDINIVKGENKNLNISFPFFLNVYNNSENVIEASIREHDSNGFKKTYDLNGIDSGKAEMELKLLGFIPVKNYNLNVVDRPNLIPGGIAIGVRLNTKGVLVVAVTDVIGSTGNRFSPAKDAGIKVGDSIIAINGIKVLNSDHVVEILNDLKDNEASILVKRNKGEFLTKAVSVKSIQDNCYRLGIWVRDKTSGIGTLTYIDQENNVYGALGHGIVDLDTGSLLPIENGKIMSADISEIQHGQKGNPGEIKGVFYETNNTIGDINLNSSFGIYGELEEDYIDKMNTSSIPIAFKEEVVEGSAEILTTIEEDKVEKFDIEIKKIDSQENPSQKSMIIKVIDKKLLEKTGGIVQGMSGSPIIQNGKLVGAVTHVFVNDPTKGYGIFIEWMLKQKKP